MKEKNRELLAGCVILYNPDVSITKNIESYLHFVNVLYVIDNSEKVDGELVDALLLLGPKIRYLPQSSNIGVASALNIGASSAVREKYNWLLTMDQDSYFFGSDFFDTWNIDGTLNNKIGLIAASYTNEYDRWQKDYSSNYNEIHFVVTSGNIINLKAWSEVNGFEDKLFIDEVDHEYCLKLRKNKYRILISKKILLGHVVGEIRQRGHILEKRRKITLHNPVRYYYISRNVLFLCKKYFFIDLKFVLQRLYYLVKTLIRIILLYPDKLMYLKFFFAGIRDFTLSKYNKLDDAIIS